MVRRSTPPGTISMRSQPARVIRGRRPIHVGRSPFFFGGFYPFGFFPGFFFNDCFAFGFDYGFGYNPCGYGYFYPGYGYYGGGSYSDYTANVTNDMTPDDGTPSAVPNNDEAVAPPSAAAPVPGPDIIVFYLKDGSSYGVTDYWLEGGRLHYVTTYGGSNAIDLDELDTQRTVDENAKQGVTFTLKPADTRDQEPQPQPKQ
jgi:hypothetical protein